MKKLIRHYVINTYALYLVSLAASGLIFEKGITTILMAGLGLTAVTIFAKPVINLLLLPLNLVTYGLFRWVSAAVALFLVELIVPNFFIKNFFFPGLNSKWLDLPMFGFDGVMKYVAFAFFLSIVSSVLFWLLD